MLEQNGWGAALDRPEVSDVGECEERKNAEFEAEEHSKQESKEETGGGDLLPEMNRTEPLRSGSRRTLGLLRIGVRSRTRKQEPEEPAKRSGITMVVRVGDQEDEPDGQQDERRRHAAPGAASVSHFRFCCGHVHLSPMQTSQTKRGGPSPSPPGGGEG